MTHNLPLAQLIALLKPQTLIQFPFELMPFNSETLANIAAFLEQQPSRAEEAYASAQFYLCMAHAEAASDVKFEDLCIWMIMIEDAFKDEFGMQENTVFERYVTSMKSTASEAAKTAEKAAAAIYQWEELVESGFHTRVIRILLHDMAARALKDPGNSGLCGAGRIVEMLAGLEEADLLAGASLQQVLDILAIVLTADQLEQLTTASEHQHLQE